ncbi:meiotic recombination protein SPO11 isoform X2 [Mus musculus]|uniref:meiotic recombination protein SPO11 isoform X2 n=1 Tax=Mus musculus TaxID=10090 RepID=UPI0003D6DEE8|nr:meiotic recombination protein SPO11 isoform X2 [Mus musculus]|eukprot:XP_006499681.1 PREDICTED: meiotic recombination protein SPO11 isoform X2 [Mus musculus]
MAFAPMGPEASFFDALDRHRASLLAMVKRGAGETPAGATRVASSSEVLTAIENIIQDIIKSLARNEVPAFTIDNRSSWENIMFDDSVGLRMIPQCTTRKIRSDSPKSVKKFALILKVLSMIYKLIQSDTYATKRDIYYTDSQLFGNQAAVDSAIDDISCMLKVPRRSLHVLSTSKGLIAGNLRYMEEDGTRVQCTCSATATAVPTNIQGMQHAKFLLIVEKDATFQRLLDDNFCSRMSPCIMVTGKGVPDLNTRLLVKKLWDTFHIPVFTLVDADPYGIEIMCIYKYGSMVSTEKRVCSPVSTHTVHSLGGLLTGLVRQGFPECPREMVISSRASLCLSGVSPALSISSNLTDEMRCVQESMSFEAHNLTIPTIRWLGLLPSDIQRLNIPKDSLIPLTKHDQMKLDSILKRPYITYQPLWKKELEMMADSKMKAEIQALTLLSSDYLSRVYLPNKLRFGGWI